MMPHSKENKLKTLRRRVKYLAERIAVEKLSTATRQAQEGGDLSYDRAEESALKWAIEHLEHCEVRRPHGQPLRWREDIFP